MINISLNQNTVIFLLPAIFDLSRVFDPFEPLLEFFFYTKIVIALILILYTHSVLNLSGLSTLIVGAIVFLVFFTDFWIFGTTRAVFLTIIGFLIIGVLGKPLFGI